MSSTYSTIEAIILKKTPYGEADFIVRALSRELGKIDFIMKGARKVSSKLNAHIDVGNHVRMFYVKNGDRMPTLADAESLDTYPLWYSTKDMLAFFERSLRTIDMLVPLEQPDQRIFEITRALLRHPTTHRSAMFSYEKLGYLFLREIFLREGYGDTPRAQFLPSEIRDDIIKLWPILRT
jgi:DNA repair protein RecO